MFETTKVIENVKMKTSKNKIHQNTTNWQEIKLKIETTAESTYEELMWNYNPKLFLGIINAEVSNAETDKYFKRLTTTADNHNWH